MIRTDQLLDTSAWHLLPEVVLRRMLQREIKRRKETGLERVEIKFSCESFYLGVSKSRGTLKWMVYNGTPY